MDEFVKNCMILGIFIEFLGVKIAIELSKNHCDLILTVGFDLNQNNLYISDILSIYLRYLLIFYRYFFRNFSTCVNETYSQYFVETLKISDISSKYRRFYRFLANQFLVGKIVSVPTDIRYFNDILIDISDSCSLVVSL